VVEIEFSASGDDRTSVAPSPDVDPGRPGLPEPAQRGGAILRIGRFTPTALWAGAAGFALAAPFRTIYILTIHEPGSRPLQETLDGWGRFAVHPALDEMTTHEARYGVVYAVGAGLFALLALGALWRRIRRHNSWRTVLQGVGIAAASLVAGVTAVVALLIQSTRDMTRAEVAQFRTEAPPSAANRFRIDLNFGGVVWFGGTAIACAVLAGMCLVFLPRQTAPTPAAIGPLPALQPGEELLG
jgi:hypothetical protein